MEEKPEVDSLLKIFRLPHFQKGISEKAKGAGLPPFKKRKQCWFFMPLTHFVLRSVLVASRSNCTCEIHTLIDLEGTSKTIQSNFLTL